MHMTRYQTIVQLTDDLVKDLDAEASRRGVSRSALVREAVTEYLASSREAEISRQIVEGYKRFPPPTIDEWGNLEEQTDAHARATLKRLAEEERSAGFPPW